MNLLSAELPARGRVANHVSGTLRPRRPGAALWRDEASPHGSAPSSRSRPGSAGGNLPQA